MSEVLKEIEELLLNPNCKTYVVYSGGRGCGRTYKLGMYKLLQDISRCNRELEKIKRRE
jgi:hypothetical protein